MLERKKNSLHTFFFWYVESAKMVSTLLVRVSLANGWSKQVQRHLGRVVAQALKQGKELMVDWSRQTRSS